MRRNPLLSSSIGLRHILEDGEVLLEGGEIEPHRRDLVISELESLLDEACTGMEFVKGKSVFVSSKAKSAVETFNLLDRYLSKEKYPNRKRNIETALRVIKQFSEAKTVSENDKDITIQLIRSILLGVKRSERTRLPNEPSKQAAGWVE